MVLFMSRGVLHIMYCRTWNGGLYSRSLPWLRMDGNCTSKQSCAFAHANNPQTIRRCFWLIAATIILDAQCDILLALCQKDGDVQGLCVAGNIGQALLRDTEKSCFIWRW